MKKTKTKCYLYTRVSTSMQVDGYSLDAQRDKLRKYAEYEDMVVAGEYSDEGFSGKNIQGRLEFQQMLERRTGLPVIMWDERLTTVAADRSMMETGIRRENRKEYVDEIAAIFILQGYLDYLSNHPEEK